MNITNQSDMPTSLTGTSIPFKRNGVDEQERASQIDKNMGLIELLESWLADPDAEDQSETLEPLMRALDEDRLSDRKLFPWLNES